MGKILHRSCVRSEITGDYKSSSPTRRVVYFRALAHSRPLFISFSSPPQTLFIFCTLETIIYFSPHPQHAEDWGSLFTSHCKADLNIHSSEVGAGFRCPFLQTTPTRGDRKHCRAIIPNHLQGMPQITPSMPRIILICFFPSGVWDVRLPTVLPSPISILCREVCEAIRGQAQSDLQPPNNKVYTLIPLLFLISTPPHAVLYSYLLFFLLLFFSVLFSLLCHGIWSLFSL